MKVTKLNEKGIQIRAKEFKWKGNGTKDEPFVIDSLRGISPQFWIKKSHVFIHLKNCNFTYICLVRAQNIIIENCTGDVYLHHCQDIKIENCDIPVFKLNYSFNNALNNCSIDYADNHFSRANQFQNNKIPPQFIKSITEGTYKELYTSIFKFLPLVLLFVISYLFTNDYIAENPLLRNMLIIGIVFLAFVEMYLLVPHYRTMKKLKTFPPNTLT